MSLIQLLYSAPCVVFDSDDTAIDGGAAPIDLEVIYPCTERQGVASLLDRKGKVKSKEQWPFTILWQSK